MADSFPDLCGNNINLEVDRKTPSQGGRSINENIRKAIFSEEGALMHKKPRYVNLQLICRHPTGYLVYVLWRNTILMLPWMLFIIPCVSNSPIVLCNIHLLLLNEYSPKLIRSLSRATWQWKIHSDEHFGNCVC